MVTTSNIYLITNKINNKKYVGQSSNIEERWYRHSIDYKRLTDRYLYRAMNKYGFENFLFEIIESDIPIESICEREMYWIQKFNTKSPNGYNMTDGGEGSFNRVLSDETKDKIRCANIGKKYSEETRNKHSEDRKKRYENDEEREKISLSMKNNKEAIEKATKNIQSYNQTTSKEEKIKQALMASEARSKSVIAIDLNNPDHTLEFKSIREAARWIRENTSFEKACHTNISKSCRGKLDFIYGYKWNYKI